MQRDQGCFGLPKAKPVIAVYSVSPATINPASGAGVVNFDKKYIDTHNAVTTGTAWTFKAPYAGFYEFNAAAYFNWGTSTAVFLLYLNINQATPTVNPSTSNGVQASICLNQAYKSDATANSRSIGGSYIAYLNSGDTVQAVVDNLVGTNSLGGEGAGGGLVTYITIKSIG